MLIPQFSLRWMLTVTSLLAVVFLVFAQAVRGSSWAVGVSLALVVLAGSMLVHGLLFYLVWLFALLTERRRQRLRTATVPAVDNVPTPFASPFASQASPAVARPEAD